MKKQYIAPVMEVEMMNASDIIATSLGFGTGSTDVMHSRGSIFLPEEDLWDE